METHQKDIEEKDPFGQNRADEADDEADDDDDEKSFLKALLAERALKNHKNVLFQIEALKIGFQDVISRQFEVFSHRNMQVEFLLQKYVNAFSWNFSQAIAPFLQIKLATLKDCLQEARSNFLTPPCFLIYFAER